VKLEYADTRGLSSRTFLQDMQEWWQAWGPRIMQAEGKQGWILLLLDAVERASSMLMTMSRILRKKPEWDTSGWAEAEWLPIVQTVEEGSAWFEKNAPRLKDVPEWAQFLFLALHGLFRSQCRVAREVQEIQRKSHLLINLTPATEGSGGWQEIE
jgi:hypothetical protein